MHRTFDNAKPRTAGRPAVTAAATKRRARFRRLLAIAAVALLVASVAAGWYVWGIVRAIDRAQSESVVDWPTRAAASQIVDPATPPADGAQAASLLPNANGTPEAIPPAASAGQASGSGQNPSAMEIAQGVLSAGSNAPSPAQLWPNRDAITVLVVGIDSRAQGGDQNADTIILARLDFRAKTLRTVSIPRDLYVTIPGVGEDKINSAYNYGVKENPANKAAGVAKLRDTIEQDFGIAIDDYILVDFSGFQKVVDALGGIDVNVPKAIYDPAYPTENYGTKAVQFAAGEQHMNGQQALEYARTRHDDNDDARRQRQEQVLVALFVKGKQLGSLTHAQDLIVALGGAVQTSFHFDEQLALAHTGFALDKSNIRMETILPPLIQPATAPNGAWIYVGDLHQIAAFLTEGLGLGPDVTPAA